MIAEAGIRAGAGAQFVLVCSPGYEKSFKEGLLSYVVVGAIKCGKERGHVRGNDSVRCGRDWWNR